MVADFYGLCKWSEYYVVSGCRVAAEKVMYCSIKVDVLQQKS